MYGFMHLCSGYYNLHGSTHFVIWVIRKMFALVAIATDTAVQPDSPHGVEVVIWGNVVLIVAGEAEFVAIALMNKVPQFFGAQGLEI